MTPNRHGSAIVEFPSDLEIVTTREFDAPLELVFDVFTNPEHVRNWFAPFDDEVTECVIDLRVGGSYHVVFVPPRTPDVCDRCGGELYQREDDSEAAVMKRLDVYASQTAPLLDYYRGRGALAEVRGEGAVADITAAIRKTVGDKVTR